MTLTPFLRLNKPPFDEIPWDEAVNGNMDILDAFTSLYMSIPNFAGAWIPLTNYVVGQNVLDTSLNLVFTCLVSHTSGIGTFLEDRTATPANWEQTIPSAPAAVATNYDVGRNAVINSQFTVAQRGVGPFTATGYTLDQWDALVDTDTFSITREVMDDTGKLAINDESAQYYLKNVFVGGAGASNQRLVQYMENVTRLAGKVITVSFWAKANATRNFGVGLVQYAGSGGSGTNSVAGQKVVLTTTWVRYSLTFTMPTLIGGTIGTDSWTSLSFYYSASAYANVDSGTVGEQSGTIDLWGVQVEVGTQASALEKKSASAILLECQRHYQIYSSVVISGYSAALGTIRDTLYYNTTMRNVPTVGITQTFSSNATTMAADIILTTHVVLKCGVTALGAGLMIGTITLSAELSD